MLIYLHGFNSSPQSHKARVLSDHLAARGLARRYVCPALPHRPVDAVRVAEALIQAASGTDICLVGSSLGGFYATHLAEKHALRAVLINPAIDPHVGLRAYLGPQQNLHSGEPYELTETHLEQWAQQYVPGITPSRYLLLVETGDEVLNYRVAVERYKGARQVVVAGGDHTLQSFPEHLPLILEFAGLADLRPGS
jgi:predicted esterase YcpF (UPF0227 family)